MTNRYKATCTLCGRTCRAHRGRLFRYRGRWRVRHFRCEDQYLASLTTTEEE